MIEFKNSFIIQVLSCSHLTDGAHLYNAIQCYSWAHLTSLKTDVVHSAEGIFTRKGNSSWCQTLGPIE